MLKHPERPELERLILNLFARTGRAPAGATSLELSVPLELAAPLLEAALHGHALRGVVNRLEISPGPGGPSDGPIFTEEELHLAGRQGMADHARGVAVRPVLVASLVGWLSNARANLAHWRKRAEAAEAEIRRREREL